MTTIKSVDALKNFKDICTLAHNGETVVVSRPHNENVIVISEQEFSRMAEAQRLLTEQYIDSKLAEAEAEARMPDARWLTQDEVMGKYREKYKYEV
jgi:antitoxin YefM